MQDFQLGFDKLRRKSNAKQTNLDKMQESDKKKTENKSKV